MLGIWLTAATRRSSTAAAAESTADIGSKEALQRQPPQVMFAEPGVLNSDRCQLLRLAHPRFVPPSGQLCLLGGPGGDRLYELLEHRDACRSWFVGDRLLPATAAALIATELDPVFVLLPLLLRDRRFQPLDEACHSDEFPDTRLLLQRLPDLPRRLADSVCDVRPPMSATETWPLVRLNADRCLAWLEAKLRRVEAGLADPEDTANAADENSDTVGRQQRHRLVLACSLLAEYLPWQLTEDLARRVGIDLDEATTEPAAATAADSEPASSGGKRSRSEKQEPLENYAFQQQAVVVASGKGGSRKPALRKESGMQSITNFFAKRS